MSTASESGLGGVGITGFFLPISMTSPRERTLRAPEAGFDLSSAAVHRWSM